MKTKTRPTYLILAILVLVAASLACGRDRGQGVQDPTQGPVAEQPTAPPSDGGQTEEPPPPPPPADPTSTPVPGGCADGMQFVADVSAPDGTIYGPNEPFIKTWRIRNAGTCTWSGYRLVFADGEPMGSMDQAIPDTPAGEELDLSIEMTAPGGVGDYTGRWRVQSPAGANLGTLTCVIAVHPPQDEGEGDQPTEEPSDEPTEEPSEEPAEEPEEEEPTEEPAPGAPAAPSNLRVGPYGPQSVTLEWDDNASDEDGFRIRHVSVGWLDPVGPDVTSAEAPMPPCGETYQFRVKAYNEAGESEPSNTVSVEGVCVPEQTVTFQSLPAEDGLVRGLDAGEAINQGDVRVGDGQANRQQQGFLSFDVSGLSPGTTVNSAVLDLSNRTRDGAPLQSLGALRAYVHYYGTLDTEDFVSGFPLGFAEWTSPPTTVDVTEQLQSAVDEDRDRFQIRLQFEIRTDDDGAPDRFNFPEGGPALTVTFTL